MISIHNTSFYQNQMAVIRSLSCEFRKGEFWGIIGKNGVGKSTLLHAMSGLSAEYQGGVLFDNMAINQMDHLSRARKISYLLQEQEPTLAFKVKDAVAMGRFPWLTAQGEDQQITSDVLSLCQITELEDRSILQLSGGERRKVEIATCLAQQAEFLLLDEPLNHLDLVYKKHIMAVLKNYSSDHGVVMVCHDIEVVKAHCTHVLMLLGNDCYLTGTSATMLTTTNLNRLFNESSQFNKK